MSNNKPHFSYINVSLLVLSNLKIVFLKKLKKKSRALHCIDVLAYNVRYLLLVQNYGPEIDLRTFLTMFRLVPSGNLKDLDLSVCVSAPSISNSPKLFFRQSYPDACENITSSRYHSRSL